MYWVVSQHFGRSSSPLLSILYWVAFDELKPLVEEGLASVGLTSKASSLGSTLSGLPFYNRNFEFFLSYNRKFNPFAQAALICSASLTSRSICWARLMARHVEKIVVKPPSVNFGLGRAQSILVKCGNRNPLRSYRKCALGDFEIGRHPVQILQYRVWNYLKLLIASSLSSPLSKLSDLFQNLHRQFVPIRVQVSALPTYVFSLCRGAEAQALGGHGADRVAEGGLSRRANFWHGPGCVCPSPSSSSSSLLSSPEWATTSPMGRLFYAQTHYWPGPIRSFR